MSQKSEIRYRMKIEWELPIPMDIPWFRRRKGSRK